MRKILVLIGALIMSNAYGGDEKAIYWLNGSSVVAATGCSVSGNITPPQIQVPDGYRFMGWQAVSDYGAALGLSKDSDTFSPKGYSSQSTWTTNLYPYTVSGTWICSSTQGSCANTSSMAGCSKSSDLSTSGDTKYCWCKLQTFGGTTVSADLPWVYNSTLASNCSTGCAGNCGYYVGRNSPYRLSMFGLD